MTRPVRATAILDRLPHHATTLNIKGERRWLKERRRAGLLSRVSTEGEQRKDATQPDADLTFADLAQCTAGLAHHPDHMRPLLGESGVIDHPHAVGIGQVTSAIAGGRLHVASSFLAVGFQSSIPDFRLLSTPMDKVELSELSYEIGQAP